MASTVFANEKPVAHQNSDGKSLTPADVCKTPVGNSTPPIPYPNLAETRDIDPATAPKLVKTEGAVPMTMGTKIMQTTGDEPGVVGGVSSGTVKGEAEPMLCSFNVFIEGKGVVRRGDLMFHNQQNTFG